MTDKTKYDHVSEELKDLVGVGTHSGVWKQWNTYKDFYLNKLTPQLMAEVTTEKFNINDVPRSKTEIWKIHNLRNILDDAEWNVLPEIILEFKEDRLREFESDNKARAERERIEKEGLEEENRARQERENAERERALQAEVERHKREQFELSACRLHEQFESDFLNAETFWKENLSSEISIESYLKERAMFVQRWIKNNVCRDLDLQQSEAAGHTKGHALITSRSGCRSDSGNRPTD